MQEPIYFQTRKYLRLRRPGKQVRRMTPIRTALSDIITNQQGQAWPRASHSGCILLTGNQGIWIQGWTLASRAEQHQKTQIR